MQDISGKHPFIQLLILGVCVAGGTVLVSLSTAVIMWVMGIPFTAFEAVDETFYANMNGLKIVQIVSQLGLFVIPAMLYAFMQRPKGLSFLGLNKATSSRQYLVGTGLTLLIIMFSMPFLAWVLKMNMTMELPEFLSGLEQWMKQSEDQLAEMTVAFLKMESFGALLVNLFVIAVVPAIAEELMFRGALQTTLQKVFGNPHVAILVTGIIFSGIHMQFYGFFPRMFIGIYLGYLFYWSGNLWFPIIGHFVNNGSQVLAVYFGAVDPSEAANAPEQEIPLMLAIGSLVLLTSVMFLFKSNFSNENLLTEKL